ncbi:PREDICTED: microtubule-associated protein TORTIFOLIA1-like [Nelumbo nucifera]|uniref:Microtubule-associated protein TORTIFOLIA1-like n=1 Tax=Nelumbo nucifera TaxID=4432 RepID=A0A1U8BCK3_NELNU|nr:PREDICTED: microtubule-associated protein TORTIFOLIA1-like [Nelumbo nucifera]
MVSYEGRLVGKYNGLSDYSSSKLGTGGNQCIPFAERSLSPDYGVSGMRGRDPPWRSNVFDAWHSYAYVSSGNGHISSRRALGGDDRSSREEHDSDQVGKTRAWNKGQGSVRLGEGPSTRSVWQASKDMATLEAIRVAGEDNETSRAAARLAIPELTAKALGNEIMEEDRDPIWASWSNVMDVLNVGDTHSVYTEVLSTGDGL